MRLPSEPAAGLRLMALPSFPCHGGHRPVSSALPLLILTSFSGTHKTKSKRRKCRGHGSDDEPALHRDEPFPGGRHRYPSPSKRTRSRTGIGNWQVKASLSNRQVLLVRWGMGMDLALPIQSGTGDLAVGIVSSSNRLRGAILGVQSRSCPRQSLGKAQNLFWYNEARCPGALASPLSLSWLRR